MPWVLTAFFAVGTLVLRGGVGSESSAKYLNPPPELIEHFHFGFRHSMADSFWLRWIQDSDSCQTYLKPVEFLKVEGDPNKMALAPRHKVCDTSWSFKMLDTVTKLDPKFWMPYLAGASTLAILVEDYEGATKIYERGLQYYPNDWQFLYRAAFHYQFNLGDKERAAGLLIRAEKNGGPNWLQLSASRLLTEVGQMEFALSNLEEYRKGVEDHANKVGLDSLDERIRVLKEKIKAARVKSP